MKRKPLVLTQFLHKILEVNRGINIFSQEFIETELALPMAENFCKNLKEIDLNTKHHFLNNVVEKVIWEFCYVNQYYHFGKDEKQELKYIYATLLDRLVDIQEMRMEILYEIRKSHLQNLRRWLKESNSFAVELYPSEISMTVRVPCEEYSAEFQMKLFGLDLSNIKQPVLDVGCGIEHHLIKYLRQNQLEVYGIDRYSIPTPGIEETDWLSYDFGKEKWGTIISNMGFSNHFQHHHLRKDGDYQKYAHCYMRMLQSLQKGGSFHYAPALPFIENLLNPVEFKVEQQELPGSKYKVIKVSRLQ